MRNRTVRITSYAELKEMGDLPVRQPMPSRYIDGLDPFLLLHHAHIHIPRGSHPLHTGVGPHPHRGFSPVTFIYKGEVHHRDSRGNSSVVGEGGVQWMNAGMGVIHSERPSKELAEKGGEQEIIQLWVNTPRKYKLDEPSYLAVRAEDMPVLADEYGKVTVRVVAGKFNNAVGAVHSYAPVLALRIEMKAGGTYDFPLPGDYNAFVYVLDGTIDLGAYGLLEEKHLAVLNNDGEGVTIAAKKDTRCILLAGLPLNEPVTAHGPYVMSNETEIMEAMRDYQMGKMGFLVEEA